MIRVFLRAWGITCKTSIRLRGRSSRPRLCAMAFPPWSRGAESLVPRPHFLLELFKTRPAIRPAIRRSCLICSMAHPALATGSQRWSPRMPSSALVSPVRRVPRCTISLRWRLRARARARRLRSGVWTRCRENDASENSRMPDSAATRSSDSRVSVGRRYSS